MRLEDRWLEKAPGHLARFTVAPHRVINGKRVEVGRGCITNIIFPNKSAFTGDLKLNSRGTFEKQVLPGGS